MKTPKTDVRSYFAVQPSTTDAQRLRPALAPARPAASSARNREADLDVDLDVDSDVEIHFATGRGPGQVLPAGVIDLARVRRDRAAAAVDRLLRRREELAATAAAYSAHDLPGVDVLWVALHEIEEAIAYRAPETWQRQWPVWVEQDAVRMHDQHDPARCPLCPPGSSQTHGRAAA